MKKFYLSALLILASCSLIAQKNANVRKDTTSWFERNVVIGQSLSMINNNTEIAPAQLQATFPKKDTASYLVNLGVSVLINRGNTYQGTLTGEIHRNTMTDSVQNNFQVGYAFKKVLSPGAGWSHALFGDVQYVYDGVAITNSLAADLLYTPIVDQSPFHVNFNANTFLNSAKKTVGLLVVPYAGAQVQEIFAASKDSSKGFIFRPLFSVSALLSFNKLLPENKRATAMANPIVTLSASYTGRWDAGNSTKYHEGYTNLFNAALNYYIITAPVKLSVGPSFYVGSDPRQGLKQQQYWLFSLNVSKLLPAK